MRPCPFGLTDEPNELVADDRIDAWLDLSNTDPLQDDLLLNLKAFSVRPMDRAMNNVRQQELAMIDPEAA
jgi:hypothetical protein